MARFLPCWLCGTSSGTSGSHRHGKRRVAGCRDAPGIPWKSRHEGRQQQPGGLQGGDGLTLVTATMVRTSPLLKGRSCSAVPWKLYLAIHSVPDGQTAWPGRGGRRQSPAGHVSDPQPPSTQEDPPATSTWGSRPSDANPNGIHLNQKQFGGFWAALGAQMVFFGWDGDGEGHTHTQTQVPTVLGFCRGTGGRGQVSPCPS